MEKNKTNNILHISTFPPRECGIATFTQDLIEAFNKKFNPVIKSQVCALNEQPTSIYSYNNNVVNEIAATELENYVSLAKKINNQDNIKIVNIQHEFGIFGGRSGDYLIPFVQALEKPVIVTFHSVIPRPDSHLKKIVKIIASKSCALVVMNKLSQDILLKHYGVPHYKICYIPHGIPQVTYEQSKDYKKEFGLENKIVLSTFGFVSKNKGIEYVIRALPRIIDKFPDIVYLVIGETHPNIRKKYGENYRNFLNREVKRLGLKDNVKFYNKYITLDEIIRFLKATDVYLSTQIDSSQSVSGTLSYALGVGRPAISTATQYAKYIVNEKNGILVKFRNSGDTARAINEILSNEKNMHAMGAKAYKDTRSMIWPNVAESYFKLYSKFTKLKAEKNKFPEIKFDHILRLTDDFGIIQFARYSKPEKRSGYSTDDISRALIVCCMRYEKNQDQKLESLMGTYMNFLRFVQRKNGSFANMVSGQNRYKDKTSEDDVQGRAIWALGYAASRNNLPQKIKKNALKCFKKSLPHLQKIKAPRAIAFTMVGLYHYLKSSKESKLLNVFKKMADKLIGLYEDNMTSDWYWFEESLTYSNAKLPEALFCAYDLLKDRRYLKTAKSSLSFLDSITLEGSYYSAIGQKGWYSRGKERSYFDQQPEDAATMVQTKIMAYKITKNHKYINDALKTFQWFLGKNYLGMMVYDEITGGCHDGLGKYELNLNQGAESTVSYLMARLSFEDDQILKAIKTS